MALVSDPHGAADLIEAIASTMRGLGVERLVPGFCDDAAFIGAERENPKLLECYGQYIQHRVRTSEEDARTTDIVPRVAALIASQVAALPRPGACVDGSLLLSRSLDRLGIWNYIVAGGFNAEIPSIRRKRHLWVVDRLDEGAGQLGHVWVVAPPFVVVDVTIKSQGWDTVFGAAMPNYVTATNALTVTMTVDDIVAPEVRGAVLRKTGLDFPDLHFRLRPDIKTVSEMFPGSQIEEGPVCLRYLPTGIRASDEALEDIGSFSGLNAAGIWTNLIAPTFV